MDIMRSTGCETPDERKAIPADASPADLDALYRRIGWKLMPLLLVAQVLAYLDRVNVGHEPTHQLADDGERLIGQAEKGIDGDKVLERPERSDARASDACSEKHLLP